MESDEAGMAGRLAAWVNRCEQGWLEELKGRFLQQAGDAILLSFDHADLALKAAQRLQHDWAQLAPDGIGEVHQLRTALHWGRVRQVPQGYVAHSLNQLARLAQEVPAGRIWGSAAFWRRLSLTARQEAVDLGWMHFKHLTQPIRVFELVTRAPVRMHRPALEAPMWPRLLVQGGVDARVDHWDLHWVAHLSQLAQVHVAALSIWAKPKSEDAWLKGSGADYVLQRRGQVHLLAAPHGWPIRSWDASLFDPHGEQVAARLDELSEAMRAHGLALARSQPSGSMSPGLLRSAALGLMHAGNLNDFERSQGWLQAWQRRYARSAQPLVWQVLWQVMRHTRGMGRACAECAMAHAHRALQIQPDHAHAWAARGFARAHLRGEVQEGMRDLEQAQALAPQLSWVGLYRSVLWSMLDRPQKALTAARAALALGVEEPMLGYALGLSGHAALFAGQVGQASVWLEDSWRQHRHHSPTLRMLVVAHQMLGHGPVARLFLRELMVLEPHLTARAYMGRARVGHARRAEMAHWLIEAGLPLK